MENEKGSNTHCDRSPGSIKIGMVNSIKNVSGNLNIQALQKKCLLGTARREKMDRRKERIQNTIGELRSHVNMLQRKKRGKLIKVISIKCLIENIELRQKETTL